MNVNIVPLNSLAVVLQGKHGGTMEMFLVCFKVSHLGLSMSWNTELAGAVCEDYFLASFIRKLLYGTQQLEWSPASINPSTKVKKVNVTEQCISTVIQFSELLALPLFSFNVQT